MVGRKATTLSEFERKQGCKNDNLPTTFHRVWLPRSPIECKEGRPVCKAKPRVQLVLACDWSRQRSCDHLTKGREDPHGKNFCTFVQTKWTRHEYWFTRAMTREIILRGWISVDGRGCRVLCCSPCNCDLVIIIFLINQNIFFLTPLFYAWSW